MFTFLSRTTFDRQNWLVVSYRIVRGVFIKGALDLWHYCLQFKPSSPVFTDISRHYLAHYRQYKNCLVLAV